MKNLEKLKAINIFVILFLLVSCQKDFPKQLNSFPNPPLIPNAKYLKNFHIVATNNFKGNLTSVKEVKYRGATSVDIGGSRLTKSYIDILRYKTDNNLLVLDAGYIIDKTNSNEEIIRTLNHYNSIRYDGILYTENELLHLQSEMGPALPFINSNIFDLSTNDVITNMGSTSYRIKEVNGLKIAMVGVTTYKKEDGIEINGHIFDDPVARLIALRNEVKSKSDLIIAIIHHQNQKDLQELVNRFSPGLVDIIIAGDPLKENKHNIPALSNNIDHHLAIGSFSFDTKRKRLAPNPQIYPLVKICKNFFKETMDCNTSNVDKDRLWKLRESKFKQIPAQFLGEKISL